MGYFKNLFSFLLFFLITISLTAQKDALNDKEDVHQVIITMFDGMREGDSAKVNSVFRKDVRMFSAYRKNTGESVLHEGKLSEFLKAIGTAHDEIWDEKIYNTTIQIDGDIAQVWTDYSFYIGETFSHCGVDAFQLVRENSKWLIINLMDTRRKEDCTK
jgi:hypothetical protein